MAFSHFSSEEYQTIVNALDIAEEKTGDYFKFSSLQWKRHRYTIKTSMEFRKRNVDPEAFAMLMKCFKNPNNAETIAKDRDYYVICLQDHRILNALKRDRELYLLSLLVYIFTHELIHIVRFCNFTQRFEIRGERRELEERIVHDMTYRVLKDLFLPKMDYVLKSYQTHRVCDLSFC